MNFLRHRVYQQPFPEGYRVLVDRVWPRGCRKEDLKLDEWARELAPSTKLRKWFDHAPAKWEEFRRRYREELTQKEKELTRLAQLAKRSPGCPLILLYGAKDEARNQAVVLQEWLEEL